MSQEKLGKKGKEEGRGIKNRNDVSQDKRIMRSLKACFGRTALRIVPEFSSCVTSLVIIFILKCIVKGLDIKQTNHLIVSSCQRGKGLSNLRKKAGQQSCLTLCLEQEPVLTLHLRRLQISCEKICTPWGWWRRLGLEASLPSPCLEHVGRCERGGDAQTTHQFPCENANANL